MKGFELARLIALEYWYQQTGNDIWDATGSHGSILDLPDDEIDYDYDVKVFEEIRARFARCPSLQDAMDRVCIPIESNMRGRTSDLARNRSCVWHALLYAEKLFRLEIFDWVHLARTCEDIAEIAMAGGKVDDLIHRANEVIGIWDDFS
jgi:hypothetical protein